MQYQNGQHDMTLTESQRLQALETMIDQGLRIFVEVGNALLEIRDSRLYRFEHGTFEEYCRERWGMARRTAYQLIDAVQVVENVRHGAHLLPTTERQARPLTVLEPEQQREAWQRAVETAPNGKVTAAHVQAVVNEYRTPEALPEPEPLPAWAADDDEPEPEPEGTKSSMSVHFSSETPEHYTPKIIIDSAFQVMGSIDLDPCSNSKNAPSVPAAKHYTVVDNGLIQRWSGRVYMNPPYGREIGDWVNKLTKDFVSGDVTEAIALVPGRIDTEWYRKLTRHARLVCHISGRLTFIGNNDPAPFPSVVVYLGDNDAVFYEVFGRLGEIWQLVSAEMIGV